MLKEGINKGDAMKRKCNRNPNSYPGRIMLVLL